MLLTELESAVQNTYALCQFLLLNPNTENGLKLDEALSKLIYDVSSLDPTARLDVNNANISDFLRQCKQLLTSESTSHSTRSRLCLLFFNLSLYNISIRRFLCGEAQLCGSVFRCLQVSITEQLGPQNLIDIFRLLQVLTYEKCLSLGSWANDLISFLISEILKIDAATSVETGRKDVMDHPLPYCMTVLCNLVSRSKIICNKIKKMGSFKHLCRRLLDFLQNNSRTVVVCSLVLIGYLDEKTRDTIFSPQNIAQSFLCIFNVLGCGDSLMTVHIAVDLLKRLVISTPIYGPCTLTSTAKNFTSYQFFEKSMQRVANLLVSFDPRSEETEKVFDLLLSFCKICDLRRAVCTAIIQTPSSEKRLTTPCLAISRIAVMSFDDAIRPELPLHALQLLTFLIHEAVDAGVKVADLVSTSTMCHLVESSIKSPIETKSHLVKFQCLRITEGLRLAEAVANDEDMRHDLLDVVNAPLCAHINESQLISNPIVGFVNKLRNSSSLKALSDDLPNWSLCGVSIPLQLLRLLATLKDYSKIHKDLYWRSLKDERIIPFIAFAISRGDDQIVYDAFVLFTHCAQVQEFPTRLLSDFVANCTVESKLRRADGLPATLNHNGVSSESLSDHSFYDMATTSHESFKQVDELLAKMKDGMDMKDVRTSQLVCAFEKKVAMHENRERELEHMIAMKEQALSQSERLRTSCQDRGNGEEVANLRMILCDAEKRLAESTAQMTALNAERGEHVARIAKMKQVLENERSQRSAEVEAFEREKKILLEENEKERELQAVLRRRFDEMTSKFDIATKTILEKQQEIEANVLRTSDAMKLARDTQIKLDEISGQLASAQNTIGAQTSQMDEQRKHIDKLTEENKKLLKIKQAMAKMLDD